MLPAAVLAECERRFGAGRPAGAFFDMIAGTSTGGIIALGLGIGLCAEAILELYVDRGGVIFPPRRYSRWRRIAALQRARHLVRDAARYRYEREPLRRELHKTFGSRMIGDSLRRLVIPTFDQYSEVNLIKTPHHPDYRIDWRETMVDVALATSAAPTFFSTYKKGDRHFADGGVWANNPVMNALVDALVCYRIERRQVRILSLGCGDQPLEFTQRQIRRGGLWHWREIISSAMHLQSQNADGQAGLLVGRDQHLRLNSTATGAPIELDDHKRAAAELPGVAQALVEANSGALANFFDATRPDFEAFHGPRKAPER